jgi:hypothetical protein
MVVEISNKDTKEEIDKKPEPLFANKKNKKMFDSKKFCGVLKLKEDAVILQRRWRDEG